MSESTLEPPVQSPQTKRPVPPQLKPYTSETASAAARKRHADERLRKEQAQVIPLLPAQILPPALPDARLALVLEQIALTRQVLNEDKLEAHHRAALLRSLCALLDHERVLRGEPLPGSLKPSSPKDTRRRGQADQLPAPMPSPTLAVLPAPIVVAPTAVGALPSPATAPASSTPSAPTASPIAISPAAQRLG